jgi:predicted ABC-type ATPase
MDLVAGPQGSGKSTFFPVAHRGHDSFNVDDRRRELNRGSSRKVPIEIRRRAIKEYGEFIEGHIRGRRSFAIEVTLGKEITFEQAERARRAGFRVHLTYVAAEVDDCIGRVANRVEAGGHGVSASILRETYAASLRNLPRAVREFDVVQVYDNSRQAQPQDAPEDITPRLVLEAQRGAITYAHPRPPRWLKAALRGSTHDLG